MSEALAIASQRRQDELLDEEINSRLSLLLANYERVTANPRTMGYLAPLLKHYAKSPTPWRDCVADNTKRFGPGRTEKVCSVLKDALRQSTHWRGHPESDVGSPGVDIGEADKPFAPAWGGHHSEEDDRGLANAFLILEDVSNQCDIFRVLVGLDEPPHPSDNLELFEEISA